MQERFEETVSIPGGAEGKLSDEVAAMELAENREVEVEVKQDKEAEERQSFWKERSHHHRRHHLHHPHGHGHGHGHGHRHSHPLHHLHHGHHHHKGKWEKLEKKRMEMCGGKIKKGDEGGWNSKFIGKLKHKIEKIDWKIGSLQEKKLFILKRIQEIEEEEERKKKAGAHVPSAPTLLPTDAA
ncbi:hypothetical protein MLD38_025936 [Melastoma candidum]|uniref:Uncharacterized protein n=1 Tax=Melastoma candidum TaxID=119954 RepID=A0ACB9P3T1_9MYRT|nr:hypothetical protein MLD38_025936 [Melastoma candidum]